MNVKNSNPLNKSEVFSFAENLRPLMVRDYVLRKKGKNMILAFNSGARNIINQTGKDILEMCDGENSLKKISEKISFKYNTSFQKTLNDVIVFIYQMARYGSVSFKKEDLQKF